MKKLLFVRSCLFLFGFILAIGSRASAQTVAEGGWKGVGYLSSISFPTLEPSRCSYRLARVSTFYPDYGGLNSNTIAYLPLSNYSTESVKNVGKIASMKFDVPLSRVHQFALALPDEYPWPRANFFVSDVQRKHTPVCEIIWSYGSKVVASDTIQPGTFKPVLQCVEFYFAGGQVPPKSEITSSIELDPKQLVLQKDSSCK